MKRILILLLGMGLMSQAQQYTRGIGVYPGDPREDFSPALRPGGNEVRNLALRCAAWSSSAYDYNLTAQLATDGIVSTQSPRYIAVSTSQQGELKKHEREWLLDHNWVTNVTLKGTSAWVQIEFHGAPPPAITRIDVDGSVQGPRPENQIWSVAVLASVDGKSWKPLGQATGQARPSGEMKPSIALGAPVDYGFYRLQFDTGRPATWTIGEVAFFNGAGRVEAAGPHNFTSAWKPGGGGEEWVTVDLGASSSIERVALHWIRPPASSVLQVSDDNKAWRNAQTLDSADVTLAAPVKARYARLLLPTAGDAILSEFEVFGRGGIVAEPRPANLGSTWRIERASEVIADGATLSKSGFNDLSWLPATVPGTALVSWLNAGALPDPNFGDNQVMISDSFFQSDFWYRTDFTAPSAPAGRKVWLHFDGVNWKADVWLNGEKLGRIEGAFQRARFDVTARLKPGGKNSLAVLVEKVATPGSTKEKTFENPDKNGGALGSDNPTYHASIGWDWIPTIRGRNTGLWNDVRLTTTGTVTVEDPLVTSKLDGNRVEVTVEVMVQNHGEAPVQGKIGVRIGEKHIENGIKLAVFERKTSTFRVTLDAPKLWWPAGYGDPYLYDAEVSFDDSIALKFKAGIREWRYSEEGGALRFWINGRRFIPKGGNWGFGESMLRYRAREYDAAMRYHADMHFNMVRNWVGQIGEDEFYEAADRHGIVVMQDFWLANPWDGPDPDDNRMFMQNARDTILRIRHHASIGLYCGRNEGYPPKPLDDGIRAALAEMHPGIHYVSSSADDAVSGHGPYRALPVKSYFQTRATPKFHSEMGMPNIVSMESLRAMMDEKDMWPQGRVWGLHDFCLTGAQGGESFREQIDRSYGGAQDVEEWITLAQFVNYDGYRAMFEAQSKNRMGLLIWMSHPTWPSFVWQTYDYYLEPTAGYFGAKKAAEPLHIQWNPLDDSVEVVNYSGGNASKLTARAEVLSLDGAVKWEKTATLDSSEDSVAAAFKIAFPEGLTPVHFVRLRLSAGDRLISENFYWRGVNEYDFRALRKLPKVRLAAKTKVERAGSAWLLSTEVHNTAADPALMVRVKAVRAKTGDRILPALYSDNYVALLPGERRVIRTELQSADTRGEEPRIVIEGFNVAAEGR